MVRVQLQVLVVPELVFVRARLCDVVLLPQETVAEESQHLLHAHHLRSDLLHIVLWWGGGGTEQLVH